MGFELRAMGMAKSRKISLGILFGGKSGEHEVSLTSAASVISALDPDKYAITAIGITKSGRLAAAQEVRAMLPPHLHTRVSFHTALEAATSGVRMLSSTSPQHKGSMNRPEIIFPLLHGPYGEDGTIQGLLEIAGLPYIGCEVLASALGMDKDVSKRIFLQAGLPVLPFIVLYSKKLPMKLESIRRAAEGQFEYPLFSKPANLGSSVGVRKIHSRSEFGAALKYSAQFDRKVILEKGINARELECAVLGNDDPKASTVGEVIPAREFYDYEAKYIDPCSRLEIPAQIEAAKLEEIRKLAVRAFHAIGGAGLARVDFFMDRRNSKIYLNEINTMPGFTPISMYAKLWAASGISFPNLVQELIRLGFERYEERTRRRISAEPAI
jgi:D-alanine-D-alanine ligase